MPPLAELSLSLHGGSPHGGSTTMLDRLSESLHGYSERRNKSQTQEDELSLSLHGGSPHGGSTTMLDRLSESLHGHSERRNKSQSQESSLGSPLTPLQKMGRLVRFTSFADRERKVENQDSLKDFFSKSFSGDLDWSDSNDDDSDDSSVGSSRDVVEEGLSALHGVASSVHGICTFLEKRGVTQDSMAELKLMEKNLQYTSVLKRAEAYAECLLMEQKKPNEHVLNLFVKAWMCLQEYSQDRYRQIQQAYREHQLKQWQAQVAGFQEEWEEETQQTRIIRFMRDESFSGSVHRRGLQKVLELTQEEAASLRNQRAQALTFMRECQKQVILAKEWSRCLKGQLAMVLLTEKTSNTKPKKQYEDKVFKGKVDVSLEEIKVAKIRKRISKITHDKSYSKGSQQLYSDRVLEGTVDVSLDEIKAAKARKAARRRSSKMSASERMPASDFNGGRRCSKMSASERMSASDHNGGRRSSKMLASERSPGGVREVRPTGARPGYAQKVNVLLSSRADGTSTPTPRRARSGDDHEAGALSSSRADGTKSTRTPRRARSGDDDKVNALLSSRTNGTSTLAPMLYGDKVLEGTVHVSLDEIKAAKARKAARRRRSSKMSASEKISASEHNGGEISPRGVQDVGSKSMRERLTRARSGDDHNVVSALSSSRADGTHSTRTPRRVTSIDC